MKKVIIAVLIVLFMAGTTGATDIRLMRNQPLGWRGWAWGTPLEEVQGWLEFGGYANLPFLGPIWGKTYVKQEDSNVYFGKNWQETQYFFEDNKLMAVAIWTDMETYATRAIEYYGWDVIATPKEGTENYYFAEVASVIMEKTKPEKNEKFFISAAKGEYASFLLLSGPVRIESEVSYYPLYSAVIIGNPEWVNRLIELVYKDK